MNTAIKTNKKKKILLTLFAPRSMLTLCKETVNTDERRLARDYQPKKRKKKGKKKEKTREKGQTKRGENRGDIGSVQALRDKVNESAGQLHDIGWSMFEIKKKKEEGRRTRYTSSKINLSNYSRSF